MAYKTPTLKIYNGAAADFHKDGAMAEKSFDIPSDGSKDWFDWLAEENSKSFRVDSLPGTFSARKELRSNIAYWYGYKRIDGKLHKSYIGNNLTTTPQTLYDIANYFLNIKRQS